MFFRALLTLRRAVWCVLTIREPGWMRKTNVAGGRTVGGPAGGDVTAWICGLSSQVIDCACVLTVHLVPFSDRLLIVTNGGCAVMSFGDELSSAGGVCVWVVIQRRPERMIA